MKAKRVCDYRSKKTIEAAKLTHKAVLGGYRFKPLGKGCATCRNSATVRVGRRYGFACNLGLSYPCGSFKDARVAVVNFERLERD